MKIIANLFFLVIFLVACTAEVDEKPIENEVERNEILASVTQKNYDTYEGTRLQIFLHAVVADETGLTFEITEGPEWVTISNKGTKAKIIIDTPRRSNGKYNISLAIKQGDRLTNRKFKLEVIRQSKTVFYIDPVNGRDDYIGSKSHPFAKIPDFSTMEKPKGHFMVLLESGVYETLSLRHAESVTIQASTGSEVLFKGIDIDSCKRLTIKSCSVIASGNSLNNACVDIGEEAYDIYLKNMHIQSALTTESWDFDDWKQKSKIGIYCLWGSNIWVSASLIENVFHGMENKGAYFRFHHNIIDRFSGDAIRNTASGCTFSYNMLKNALISDYSAPDGNHDDLYQSWTFDLPISNVTLSHNIAIDVAEKDLKLASNTVQGFACFDGFVEGWKIKNNLILLDHPHGIALFGAENCAIENNTVARNPYKRYVFESEPWIMVTNHKDGRPSLGTIVKNNLTTALIINDTTAIQENNVVMDTLYKQFFEDYSSWNFNKKETRDKE